MRQQIAEFAHAPIGTSVFWGEQTANRDAKPLIAQIHQHQCQQEVRRRQTDKGHKRRRVVEHRILPERRIHPHRKSDQPGQQGCREGNQQGKTQALPDQVVDRLSVHHRIAHIADKNAANPLEILDMQRVVEIITGAQCLDLFLGNILAFRL